MLSAISVHQSTIVYTRVGKDKNLNIKAKMFEFESRVLIGWLANILN